MNARTPITPDPEDFDAIEAAVLATERGRRFLAEYARRNRAADTAAVLAALDELGGRMTPAREPDRDVSRLAVAISKMAVRLALMRDDLESPGRPDRRVVRALRRLAAIDRLAGEAASVATDALGAAAPPCRPRPAVAPPEAEDRGQDAFRAERTDAAQGEVVAAFDIAPPAAEAAIADAAEAEANGTSVAETPDEKPQPSGGLRLPHAWTPEFLLGLADDDRRPPA